MALGTRYTIAECLQQAISSESEGKNFAINIARETKFAFFCFPFFFQLKDLTMSEAHYNVQTIVRPRSHIKRIKQIVLIKYPYFTNS